uniref:Uncharacterized protein n=1 Tax=Timema monikensis TaxID=170555 RepID=A0A7R9HRE3_9NEOP|nr:unnamed protein product [Timema monikensis]
MVAILYQLGPEFGRRVWLEITDLDMGPKSRESLLELDLGSNDGWFQPFQIAGHLTDGAYLSHEERLMMWLRTGDEPLGRGFKAIYKSGTIWVATPYRTRSRDPGLDVCPLSTSAIDDRNMSYPALSSISASNIDAINTLPALAPFGPTRTNIFMSSQHCHLMLTSATIPITSTKDMVVVSKNSYLVVLHCSAALQQAVH